MSDRIRGRIVRVVDGDTVTMRFADGTFTVRLWGIDAPESSQPYGPMAAAGLRAVAEGEEAVLHLHKTGPYGRLIGEVEVWGESRFFAGRALALAGLAWADRQHATTDLLRELEQEARREGKGLWSQERPVPPWRHRAAPRPSPATGEGWGTGLIVLLLAALLGLILLLAG
jgi:endonuclease YncB( thermonuclease family)